MERTFALKVTREPAHARSRRARHSVVRGRTGPRAGATVCLSRPRLRGEWFAQARGRRAAPGGKVLSTRDIIALGAFSDGPQLSPDESQIVLGSDSVASSGWGGEIWKSLADGSDTTQLTSLGAHSGTPRWSPDGQSIAFDTRPGAHSQIYVMDADGRNQRMLIGDNADNVPQAGRTMANSSTTLQTAPAVIRSGNGIFPLELKYSLPSMAGWARWSRTTAKLSTIAFSIVEDCGPSPLQARTSGVCSMRRMQATGDTLQ